MKYVLQILLTFALIVSIPSAVFAAGCKPFPKGKAKVEIKVNGASSSWGKNSKYHLYVDESNQSHDYVVLPRDLSRKISKVSKEKLGNKKIGSVWITKYRLKSKPGQSWVIDINGCKYKEMIVYVQNGGNSLHHNYATTNVSHLYGETGQSLAATPKTSPKSTGVKNTPSVRPEKIIQGIKGLLQQAGF